MLKNTKKSLSMNYKKLIKRTKNILDYPRDLDLVFYKSYYDDLKSFSSDIDVVDHFIRHGRQEGRFPNSESLKNALSAEFGSLPPDFFPSHYRLLNGDLSHLHNNWALEEHYLRHGRSEGREYGKTSLKIYERDFARLLAEDVKSGRTASLPIPTSFFQLLMNARVLPGGWLNRFTLYEFAILNAHWLPRTPRTRLDGLRLFLEQGVDRLAPIAMGMTFDPSFYRREGLEPSINTSDADLYRDWLSHGIDNIRPGNEAEALRFLIGEDNFPESFDAEKYYASLSKKARKTQKNHRFDLLSHFISTGFPRGVDCLQGDGAPRLLGQISDYHIVRQNPSRALEACNVGLSIAPDDATLLHRRGDVLRVLGQTKEATRSYVAAVDSPDAGMWTHIHAADGLAAEPDGADLALDQLLSSARLYRGEAEWRAAAHRVISRAFDTVSRQVRVLYTDGQRQAADACLTTHLDRVVEVIGRIDPLPARLAPPRRGTIVIVANRDLPQCDHYRVVQKCAQLAQGGWTVELFAQDEAGRCRPSIDQAEAVIFYRVAAFPAVLHAILYARSLSVPTLYEIDDLLFDERYYPDPFESFEGQITEQDYVGLQYGVPLFRYAMRLCDSGIASTPALAEAMRPHFRTGICHVLRNGLDKRNSAFVARTVTPFASDVLTVFYGSGTKAHNRDFNELVAPALLKVLARHENVRILIAGYLHLDDRFSLFADRVRQLGFSASVSDYWEVLSGVDINLAVLAGGAMADAKSEIKWLEAAMCGIPSIVSGTRTYREILVNKETALIADTPAEWAQALETLIDDAGLRRAIGMRARTKAIAEYGLDAAVAVLAQALPMPSGLIEAAALDTETPAAPNRPTNRHKPRILFANVYFPPQLVGGATRVVRDNLDHFLDEAGDRFDFAVVAEDAGAEPPYRTRIDNYRGVPVYRISAPREVNMDWRPLNPEMRPAFEDLLDRFMPDLVHIHCIQHLTASLVEALRVRGVPYIITLHDAWWISDFQFLINADGQVQSPSPDPLADETDPTIDPFASLARRRALGRFLDGAEALLAVSDSFAEIYRAAGHPQTKAISNGSPMFTPVVKRPSPTGRVRLGQIGGRTTHKGATLIEAVLRDNVFRNLELTLVDHARPANESREEVWGTTPVRLIGRTPQDRIAELYAELDVLLAPSVWPESFGLVTREAQAAGLWVVASDRGAIGADIIEDVDGFCIDVGSTEGLRVILARIDADPSRFRVNPPLNSKPRRTAKDQGNDLLALYESLLHIEQSGVAALGV